MVRGSVFMTNGTQAMRLPDGVTSVDIFRRGQSWLIGSSNANWTEWFEGETVSDDFLSARKQPDIQERDAS